MYLEHWRLREKPFENTADPRFFYHSPQHEEGLARLLYVVREGKGAGLLTGTYGCGKTLLGHQLFSELERDVYRTAFLTNPRLDDIEMLRMIVHLLGMPEVPTRKADVLMALEQILDSNFRDGRKTVIVIDEAHAIEQPAMFEELRLLLNYQADGQFLATLLILGQPELKAKIEANKQLNQRIAVRFHLQGLSAEDTASYILHRMLVAGARQPVFDEGALSLVHERSAGIPRRINQICDFALLTGLNRRADRVTPDIVREAIESLEK